MKIIGLTGGIGSGKSAVAKRFAELGIPVIDADTVGHDVLAPGGAAEEQVIKQFGEAILTDHKIDREKLGQYVFGNEEALQKLNSIVHPSITAEIGRRCAKYACEDQMAVIIEATLIGEQGKRDAWLDALILVDAPLDVRLERLTSLRGMGKEDALKRIKAQSDPLAKRSFSTWVIDNGGSLSDMHAQVDAVYQAILEDAE